MTAVVVVDDGRRWCCCSRRFWPIEVNHLHSNGSNHPACNERKTKKDERFRYFKSFFLWINNKKAEKVQKQVPFEVPQVG